MQTLPPAHLPAQWTPAFARRTQGASSELAAILALASGSDLISFAGGFPDPRTFPSKVLAQLTAEVLAEDAAVALQYSPTPGLAGLRAAFSDRLAATDGRRPGDGELMVTSGTIDALGLVARALIDPGDIVAVESPTYLGGIDAFRGFEADLRGIPIDRDGLDTDALDQLCRTTPPKLLYTIPDHQNPTGITMSAERRSALVEICRRHRVLVLEDVAYRELTFAQASAQSSAPTSPLAPASTRSSAFAIPSSKAAGASSASEPNAPAAAQLPPTLWSLAPDIVVQAGTTSKTFFPGVRLGWGVGPRAVVEQMVVAKQNTDQCAGAFGQRLLEGYLRGGHMDVQLRQSNALYASRCARMLAALDEYMPNDFTWTRPRGGFFTWLTGWRGLDATALARQARDAGVAFVPGRPFHSDGSGANQLRLAFSRADDDDIDEGIQRLATLVRSRSRLDDR